MSEKKLAVCDMLVFYCSQRGERSGMSPVDEGWLSFTGFEEGRRSKGFQDETWRRRPETSVSKNPITSAGSELCF